MSNDDQTPDELTSALETLADAGSVPPEDAWETLAGWDGGEATRALVEAMRDRGPAAVHAVRLLAERGDTGSIEAMVEMLVDGDTGKLLRDEVTFACHNFGGAALDPLLDAYDEAAEAGDRDAMSSLLEAAFETGARGRRMSEALAAHVEHDPAVARRMLSEYESTDDVITLLEERAAEIPELGDDDRPAGEAIQAVWNTIEQFGGDIPDALRRQMRPTPEPSGPSTTAGAFITGQLDGHASSADGDSGRNSSGRDADVGRNDPCPCGSGRKYKQCCLRDG